MQFQFPTSKIVEYVAVLGTVITGTLWIGHVADQGNATAQTVDSVLTPLPKQVAVLEERTKSINKSLEEIKAQQLETQRLILEALAKKDKK